MNFGQVLAAPGENLHARQQLTRRMSRRVRHSRCSCPVASWF